MKIKNSIRKLTTILLIIFIFTINTVSFATIDVDNFKPGEVNANDAGKAIQLGEKIIGGLTTVGIIVSFLAVMGMGIKYMVGSIEEKAEYKKTMMPMLIGMMFIFGISWIIKLIYNTVTSIS